MLKNLFANLFGGGPTIVTRAETELGPVFSAEPEGDHRNIGSMILALGQACQEAGVPLGGEEAFKAALTMLRESRAQSRYITVDGYPSVVQINQGNEPDTPRLHIITNIDDLLIK